MTTGKGRLIVDPRLSPKQQGKIFAGQHAIGMGAFLWVFTVLVSLVSWKVLNLLMPSEGFWWYMALLVAGGGVMTILGMRGYRNEYRNALSAGRALWVSPLVYQQWRELEQERQTVAAKHAAADFQYLSQNHTHARLDHLLSERRWEVQQEA